ncbi:MAG: DUF1801 domain-containing protein [Chitinophagaceae bacterium]|nr:DUF1801 domain-containing protein [Chitinophagaceae bacterium]
MNLSFKTVDEYIAAADSSLRPTLQKLRDTIRKSAPNAEETISYGMPAYKLGGQLVFFAAYKGHIGFYPTSHGIPPFKKELARYKTSKGAIQFPIGEALPWALITQIVKLRVKQNKEKLAMKAVVKKKATPKR